MLLLDDVAVAVDPPVADRPLRCGVDVKQIYIQPRPHSTRPEATHEHAREREEKVLTLDTPRKQHDTQTQLSCHSRDDSTTRDYTTNALYNETETSVFCVLLWV